MKSLNLDALVEGKERSVTLGGKEHKVVEMTVENYIQTTLDANKLEEEGTTIADQIEATIRMIQRSVPTIDEKTLRRLTLDQLRVFVAFVRGEDVDESAGEEGQAPAGGGAEPGK